MLKIVTTAAGRPTLVSLLNARALREICDSTSVPSQITPADPRTVIGQTGQPCFAYGVFLRRDSDARHTAFAVPVHGLHHADR